MVVSLDVGMVVSLDIRVVVSLDARMVVSLDVGMVLSRVPLIPILILITILGDFFIPIPILGIIIGIRISAHTGYRLNSSCFSRWWDGCVFIC